MSIWISKARILAVLSLIALSGCDELDLAQGANGEGAKAVTQASLASGQVRVAAPDGYCIDPRSLRTRFALLGRCDTLGVRGFYNDRDLAIITASTLTVDADTASPDAAALSAQGQVVRTEERGGLPFVQLRDGNNRIDGVSDTYWRTAIVLNEQLVSFVLYAPPDSPALGRDGARLLERTILATRQATRLADG